MEFKSYRMMDRGQLYMLQESVTDQHITDSIGEK